jgi:transposase
MTIREVPFKEIQGWDTFEKRYKPVKNKFRNDGEYGFETYGEELEYIQEADPNYVWTWVQGDMSDIIVPGKQYVNRLAYYVCEVPWTDEDEYVLLSVEVECYCYNEDGYENGEYGKEGCEDCEGYGYVTEYV